MLRRTALVASLRETEPRALQRWRGLCVLLRWRA